MGVNIDDQGSPTFFGNPSSRNIPASTPPNAQFSQRTDPKIDEQQVQVAADGDPIPIIYGHQRIGAQVLTWVEHHNDLLVHCQWCIGGELGVESIFNVFINNEPVPKEIEINTLLGTKFQSPQPRMVSAIPGFDDDLVADVVNTSGVRSTMGVANSVVVVPPGIVEGVPIITAEIEGLKCYDPRYGSRSYTRNPSLILGDFITNQIYGWGKKIDWVSVGESADHNDDRVLSTDYRRRRLDLAIITRRPCHQIVKELANYAGVFVNFVRDQVVLVPDRPAPVSRTLTNDDFLEKSIRLKKGKQENAPTVIEVEWTDKTTTPWSSKYARAALDGVEDGTLPWRHELIRMPGITNHEQADREARERMNRYTQIDLTGSHIVGAEGLIDLAGDVLEITHDIGLSSKKIRLLSNTIIGPHTWSQKWEEYSDAIYSDEIVGEEPPPDTNLPNPFLIPALNFVTAEERPFTDQNGRTYSTMRVKWQGSPWPFVSSYEVDITGTNLSQHATVNHSSAGADHEFVSHQVKQGILYTASVRIVSTVGGIGPPTSTTLTLLGKLLNPTDVPWLTGFEAGTYVFLKWGKSFDEDLTGYQIRRNLTAGSESVPWEDWDIVERSILSEEVLLPDQPIGTYRYVIRAHDSRYDLSDDWDYNIGFSRNWAFTDILITVNFGAANGFAALEADEAAYNNMSVSYAAGFQSYCAPNFGETWRRGHNGTERWVDVLDHWILPYDSVGKGDASISLVIQDMGKDYTGKFSWNAALGNWNYGSPTSDWYSDLFLQTDAGEITYPSGSTAFGTARYVGAIITVPDGQDYFGLIINFPFNLSLSMEELMESDTVFVDRSTRVLFTVEFSRPPEIILSVDSTNAAMATFGNVSKFGFDIFVWRNNSPSTATVTWLAVENENLNT